MHETKTPTPAPAVGSVRRCAVAIVLGGTLVMATIGCGSDATTAEPDASAVPVATTAPIDPPAATAPADTAQPTAPAAPTEPTVGEATPETPETPETRIADADAAAAAVSTYVETVAAGDLATAWTQLSQRSQDALGGQAEFDSLGSALAEGIAAYAAAPDLETRVTPVADGAYAVTLSGTVSQEGPPQLDAASMIVRADGVSPFEGLASGAFVSFEPGSGSQITSGDVISPTIQGGEPVTASINGDVVDLSRYSAGADPARYDLPVSTSAPGRAVVTVVIGSSDELASYAAAFTVAG